MTHQLELLDVPTARARRSDPKTSHAAAASVVDGLPALEARVMDELVRRGDCGATSEELAAALDLSLVTVSPRLRPLANKQLVVASSDRRRGTSGRQSIVWKVATPGGIHVR